MHSRILSSLLVAVVAIASANANAESDAAQESRMEWWRQAKFGMFIHWGVYSVPAGNYQGKPVAGIGEWIMKQAPIPVDTYRGYAKQFNPTKYDPTAWAKLAKEAGMRYVVITAKHHDGFALYNSPASDWNIVDASPYGKGLLAPLANAIRDEGLKFGLYYSQAQDWTHPGGAKMGMAEGQGWDEKHKGDFDEYLRRIAVPQTEEILTRFNPDVLWWDTPTWMNAERAKPLHALIAQRPNLITNNRLGGGYQGDTETPEQHIPATGYKNRDWETCMTMNDTWGFKSDDHNWKSNKVLLHNLVDIVSKGGNYLLNVGPDQNGEIPQESIDRLRAIGNWMAVNGEAIYGTTASPCRKPAWGRITSKPNKLYLHVFHWPEQGKLVLPVEAKVESCRLLADTSRTFECSSSESGIVVQLEGSAVDPICTVVELQISGSAAEVFPYVAPAENGSLALSAADAYTTGNLRVETIGNQQNLGHWTNAGDTATWYANVGRTGQYRLTAEVAGPADGQLAITVGKDRLALTTAKTGNYQQFEVQTLGNVEIVDAGKQQVMLQPVSADWNPINLRNLRLTPIE